MEIVKSHAKSEKFEMNKVEFDANFTEFNKNARLSDPDFDLMVKLTSDFGGLYLYV